ncbi:MAG: hypothetical protein HZA53_16790 [Planctomycetes bacterium]|nr:hypothetical protein [Planctomycetota bacterium]
MTRYLPLLLIVLGNVVYHLGQKTMPKEAPPTSAIVVAYLVGIAACLVALPFFEPGWSIASARPALSWSTVLVGLGAAAIEIGFLLAYRSGWPISSASLVALSVVALVLLPIGVRFFAESWSWSRTLGLVLCLAGLWFLRQK